MSDQSKNPQEVPELASPPGDELTEPVYITNEFEDRGLVEQLHRSTQKLTSATHRVAQTLLDSPALATTERSVALRRSDVVSADIEALWWAIHTHTEAISFPRYFEFMERVLCGGKAPDRDPREPRSSGTLSEQMHRLKNLCHLPGVDAYQLLKTATEAFLLLNCGVCPSPEDGFYSFSLLPDDATNAQRRALLPKRANRLGAAPGDQDDPAGGSSLTMEQAHNRLREFMGEGSNNYLTAIVQGAFPGGTEMLASPYCVTANLRLDGPCLLELIWSYWMEEGMLNQTVAAITRRFQNVRRAGRGPDPLTELELDPLRPLNGFLWGYLQDEPNRLSVVRRAYEYNHHYGLTLYGRAVPSLRPADPRSRFLEAFHNLIRQAAAFYKEDNDTTVIADAFPVLNSLKEAHLVLSEGAHNQFRDLPWTSRVEMLLQQWILARPELREFLRGRYMVAYPEPWMGAVDSMKRLQGWTDTSVIHFRDLARFGERILLSIRYGHWSAINNQDVAKAWLRYWKEEIQGYVHAYHTATGVNLSDDVVEVRERADVRYLQPSYHLRNRLLATRRDAARRLR